MRLETGAGFSEHNCGFELSPPIYPESKIYPEKIKTFFIPVSIYCYFNKNFYLNIGIMADFEASRKDHWIDSQEGIGFNIATGKEFRINSLVINVSPGMEIHGIIPFQPVENQLRLAVFGIKAGVGYNFKKHEKKTTDQVTE